MVERLSGGEGERGNRVVVVTDLETADGFQLGGVQVEGFASAPMAAARIEDLLDDESVELVFANEEYVELLGPATRKRIEEPAPPMVVALPHKGDYASRMHSLNQFIQRSGGDR